MNQFEIIVLKNITALMLDLCMHCVMKIWN